MAFTFLETHKPLVFNNIQIYLLSIPFLNFKKQAREKWLSQVLKTIFYIFEKSQEEHNKLKFIFSSFLNSIIYKVPFFKNWCKLIIFQKSFCMFKATITSWFYFQTSFFFIKCVPFLLKIEDVINIDYYKRKSTWNW